MPVIKFQEKNIFYQREGHGKPVVFLHGFGEDGRIWANQVKHFSKTHTIIVPDLPGSGKSELLEGAGSMEVYADVLHAIIQKEILNDDSVPEKHFSLIGHSMGGYISLAFLRKYPDLPGSLGLFHSSAFADTGEKIETRKKTIHFIQENGSVAYVKTAVPALFSSESRSGNPALVEWLVDVASTISPEALIQYTKAMINREDTTNVLESFEKPVLFILGKHDEAVPLETGLKQSSIPAVSSIYVLQKSGHLGMLEQQDLSNNCLSGFFSFLENFRK